LRLDTLFPLDELCLQRKVNVYSVGWLGCQYSRQGVCSVAAAANGDLYGHSTLSKLLSR